MEKFSNFFERILQIIEYYNIRSINDFAKNYLGYASSEKINRLKDPSKNPSFEILQDISNRFEEISPDWLFMGNGEMLRNSPKITVNGDKNFANNGQLINSHIDYRDIHSDSPDVLRAQIDVLDERIREKDAQIKEKDAQIKEKDAQIKEKDAQIKEKDAQIKEKDAQIKEKDAQIASLHEIIKQLSKK